MNNDFPMAIEMPSELWVNDQLITSFMCSPYDLEDLAVGHLLTRGIVKSIHDIEEIKVDDKTYQIFVKTNKPISKEWFSVPEFVLSGVSSVNKFNDKIYKIKPVNQKLRLPLSKVIESAQSMVDDAVIYKETGGVHAAIITDINGNNFLREDIGRHCAVDKAIGSFAKKYGDFSTAFICTTGRISLDMLLKSASMGLPLVSSLKYPSDMGVKLANHYGITILARVLSDRPMIYTNNEKIVPD